MLMRPALLLAVGFTSLLGGCADNSSPGVHSLDSQPQEAAESAVATSSTVEPFSDPSPIVIDGLWDFSQDYRNGMHNVRYVEVTEDGTWRVWDYQGDNFDQGDSCYISSDSTIERTGGSDYRLIDGDVVLDISATAGNSELTLVFTSGRSLHLPRVDALSPIDFNRCDLV